MLSEIESKRRKLHRGDNTNRMFAIICDSSVIECRGSLSPKVDYKCSGPDLLIVKTMRSSGSVPGSSTHNAMKLRPNHVFTF